MSNSSPPSLSYRRPWFDLLRRRLDEPRRFLQVVLGPRQVGKTTLVQQVAEGLGRPTHYATADGPSPPGSEWIEQQWEAGRAAARASGQATLILDEIQKAVSWPEAVKRLWDEDSRRRLALRVVLLGSSALLVQKGLTESLAGRFEVVHLPHWSFTEMRAAFGWEVDRFIYFGGYPGAAPLADERDRWAAYVRDSLIETTVSRDILLLTRVDKPALLRRLFQLACDYSGQILSYQKMLGQLHDAGNTTTLAHYLDLLAGAGLAVGLSKYSGSRVRQRGSIPKLQILNTGLVAATSPLTFEAARADHAFWGRLVETAVGAHLYGGLAGTTAEVLYWRERNVEVDFVLRQGRQLVAVEVKSGRRPDALPGMAAFTRSFSPTRKLLVGGDGIPVADFLTTPPGVWLRRS